MDQPVSTHAKKVVPNHKIGLNSDKIDEININFAVFKFLNGKKEAPIPTRSVGETSTLRKRILQLSLFPDIYDKNKKVRHPGNVDFGESHGY
jgi:hypothetical protein